MKKVANDGTNLIRIDDPKDIVFLNDKELFESSDKISCFIIKTNKSDCMVKFVTFSKLNVNSYLLMQTADKMIVKG